MGNVRTDQGTDPGRVHEGNFGEINNECLGGVGPDLGLKLEQTGERQDALSILRTGSIFNNEGLL
jgi:hypothetical protein